MSTSTYPTLAYALIVAGVLAVIGSWLGCGGVTSENRCVLLVVSPPRCSSIVARRGEENRGKQSRWIVGSTADLRQRSPDSIGEVNSFHLVGLYVTSQDAPFKGDYGATFATSFLPPPPPPPHLSLSRSLARSFFRITLRNYSLIKRRVQTALIDCRKLMRSARGSLTRSNIAGSIAVIIPLPVYNPSVLSPGILIH